MKIKNKKTILTILSILTSGFFLIYLWILSLNYLIKVKNENTGLAEELELANLKIKKTKNMEELYENLKFEKDITENIILNKENFINLIEKLEDLAKSANTELNINSAVMPRTSKEYPVLSLEIKGDYEKILNFIKLIENLPYITFFEKATLQKDSAEEKEYPWTAFINLKILSYR